MLFYRSYQERSGDFFISMAICKKLSVLVWPNAILAIPAFFLLWPNVEVQKSLKKLLIVCRYYNVIFHILLNVYWSGQNRAQVLLLVWPP